MIRSLALSSRGHTAALRRVLALLLLLGLLLIGLPPAPALAASCQVTTTANDGGAGSLRALVANPGCATITFAAGIAQVPLVQPLEIARSVTLLGPGADKLALVHVGPPGGVGIPGFPTGNVLTIRAGTVDLRGLTITGGQNLGSWGGGLTVIGAPGAPVNLTLNGIVVDRNFALGGGGIYASNAALLLYDTTLSNNGTASVGDPSYGGGGLFIDDVWGAVSAYLVRPIIIGNGAGNNQGGGIRAWHRASVGSTRLTVVNGTVGTTARPNTARLGGGIAVDGALSYVIGSVVGGNTAVGTLNGFDTECSTVRGCGGGIYATQRGSVTMTNSTVSGNRANYVGGGLYSEDGTVTLTSSTVSGNQGDRGGGLATVRGTARLTNSTISGNVGESRQNLGFGSGLDLYYSATTMSFVTVTGNRAGDGSGVAARGGSLAVQRSIVAGNTTGGNASSDCSIYPGVATSQGFNIWGSANCPNNAAGGDRSLAALNVHIGEVLNQSLLDNGGPTKTHALVNGGLATSRIPSTLCVGLTDQRGVARPQGLGCDIGAVEWTAPLPSATPVPSPSPLPSQSAPPSPSPGP